MEEILRQAQQQIKIMDVTIMLLTFTYISKLKILDNLNTLKLSNLDLNLSNGNVGLFLLKCNIIKWQIIRNQQCKKC